MLTKLKFTVTHTDGRRVEAVSRPATEVAFERKFGQTVGSLFSDIVIPAAATDADKRALVGKFINTIRQDWLYFLAWHSTRSELPYDEWLETVDEIDWEAADPARPTRPTVQAGL